MQIAGTTDTQLQLWMKEMEECSNEIAAPIVDLVFRTFPVLLKLPFSMTKKPAYCRYTIDEIVKIVRKISVRSMMSKKTIQLNVDLTNLN